MMSKKWVHCSKQHQLKHFTVLSSSLLQSLLHSPSRAWWPDLCLQHYTTMRTPTGSEHAMHMAYLPITFASQSIGKEHLLFKRWKSHPHSSTVRSWWIICSHKHWSIQLEFGNCGMRHKNHQALSSAFERPNMSEAVAMHISRFGKTNATNSE